MQRGLKCSRCRGEIGRTGRARYVCVTRDVNRYGGRFLIVAAAVVRRIDKGRWPRCRKIQLCQKRVATPAPTDRLLCAGRDRKVVRYRFPRHEDLARRIKCHTIGAIKQAAAEEGRINERR